MIMFVRLLFNDCLVCLVNDFRILVDIWIGFLLFCVVCKIGKLLLLVLKW